MDQEVAYWSFQKKGENFLIFGFTVFVFIQCHNNNGLLEKNVFTKNFSEIYEIINCIISKSFFNREKHLDFTKQYLSEIFLISTVYRSSQWRCSLFKKGLHTNFAKFTGKHLCLSLFFNKVAGLRPEVCNFIKK